MPFEVEAPFHSSHRSIFLSRSPKSTEIAILTGRVTSEKTLNYGVFSGTAVVQINKIFRAVQLLVFELVPCLIMIVVHGRIFAIRRKHCRQISLQLFQLNAASTDSIHGKRSGERANYRAKKSVGVTATLVSFYVSCWFFSAVLTSCDHFEICEVSQEAQLATSLLVYLNPAVNAFICLFMKADIRKELWKLF